MSEHFVITADHGHLRVFQQREVPEHSSPALDEIQAEDFPAGFRSYVQRDTDRAGRFQSSKHQGRGPGAPTARQGMSVDERLPMQREEERRQLRDLAAAIEDFLVRYPHATWDFAAGPEVHNAVLEALSPAIRTRLQKTVTKDLAHQPPADLIGHFAAR
jgi:hypothetical protein